MDLPKTKKSEAALAVACPSDDALVEVLSRLRAKPLFRFKCVSKDWCGLIADRLRCRKFPQTLEGFFTGGSDENYGDFIDLSGRPVPVVDPSFSFLTESPEIEKLVLLDSCNGFVLFGHMRVSDTYDSLGYIVCNPATEQWVPVPNSGWTPWEGSEDEEYIDDVPDTYLIFDPAASPHFQLVQLYLLDRHTLEEVHIFSSVTWAWRRHEGIHDQAWVGSSAMVSPIWPCRFNGMLHMGIFDGMAGEGEHDQYMIVAVDGEGKPSMTMNWPENGDCCLVFVGQSQGRLHYCMTGDIDDSHMIAELSIWVLEDYHTKERVLKHSVSILQLFGKMSCRYDSYEVVTIHPDRNLVYFIEHGDQKLISYDMDNKEVCDVCTLRRGDGCITPYVPYFSDLLVLENRHRMTESSTARQNLLQV